MNRMLSWIAALALLLAGTEALAADPTGRWQSSVAGETVTLTLAPGGSGDLEGMGVGWRASGNRVTLIVEGSEETGRIEADRLVFESLTFQRAGGGAKRAAVRAPVVDDAVDSDAHHAFGGKAAGSAMGGPLGAAFAQEPKADRIAAAPAKGGSRRNVAELGVSFVLPPKWQGGWQQQQNGRIYVLRPKGTKAAEGQLTLATIPLSAANQARPTSELLGEFTQQIARSLEQNGLTLEPAGGVATLEAEGGSAARQLFQVRLPNGQTAEFYLAGVKSGGWGYTLQGNWTKAKAASFRSGADAILASLQAGVEDNSGGQQIIGCWSISSSSTGSTSYDRSSEKWTFTPDGRYSMTSLTVMSGEFGSMNSRDSQQGAWSMHGSQLLLRPDDGEPFPVTVHFQGGMAVVGGRKFLPCR